MRRDAWTYAGARRVSRIRPAACRRSAVPLLGRRSSRWADRSRRPSRPRARRRARARGVRDPPRTGAHARRLRGRVPDARRRQCLCGGGRGVPLDDAGLRAKTQPHRTHGVGRIRVLPRRDLRRPSDPAPGEETRRIEQLDARAAAARSAAGDILLDVREQSEWDAGHAPGAVHIPYENVRARAHELPVDRRIVTYCGGGIRSSLAASILESSGHAVANLRGGFTAWRNARLEISMEK